MKKITMFTDGGSRNNPGIAGAGVFIADENGKELKKAKKFLGIQTNNWAEYEALVLGLETLKKMFSAKTKEISVEVKMDSQLIVRQLNGEYRVKEPSLFQQFVKVNNLKIDFPNIKFTHIPRAENKKADKLANQAMDEGI
ncbi:ribonuclease HI family protein [Patescibacteria group bacterium]